MSDPVDPVPGRPADALVITPAVGDPVVVASGSDDVARTDVPVVAATPEPVVVVEQVVVEPVVAVPIAASATIYLQPRGMGYAWCSIADTGEELMASIAAWPTNAAASAELTRLASVIRPAGTPAVNAANSPVPVVGPAVGGGGYHAVLRAAGTDLAVTVAPCTDEATASTAADLTLAALAAARWGS